MIEECVDIVNIFCRGVPCMAHRVNNGLILSV